MADEIARVLTSGVVRDRQTGVAGPAVAGDIAILFRTRDGHQAFQRALEAARHSQLRLQGSGLLRRRRSQGRLRAACATWPTPSPSCARRRFCDRGSCVCLIVALVRWRPGWRRRHGRPAGCDDELDDDDRAVLAGLRRVVPTWLALADRIRPSELLDRVLAETAYASSWQP